jgi:hypothetical protein
MCEVNIFADIDKPLHLNEQGTEQVNYSEISVLMNESTDEAKYFENNLEDHKMKMHFWVSNLERKLSRMIEKDFFSNMYTIEDCIQLEENFANHSIFLIIFSVRRRQFD